MIIDRNAVTQEVPIDPETGKPYLNTVAAIQVSANGVGSEVSPYVAQAVEVIRESGLPQETNALFTNVEGDLDDVLKVAGEAAKKLAEQGYRTSLVLHMDIRPGFTGQLTEKPDWWMRSSPTSRRSSKASLPPARACFVITRFMGR